MGDLGPAFKSTFFTFLSRFFYAAGVLIGIKFALFDSGGAVGDIGGMNLIKGLIAFVIGVVIGLIFSNFAEPYQLINRASFTYVLLYTAGGFIAPLLNKCTAFFYRKLFIRVSRMFAEQEGQGIRGKDALSLTIVGILVLNRAKQHFVIYIVLFSSLILYSVLPFFLKFEPRLTPFLVIFGFILALYINQKALEYRVWKGLYGNNEYEAREIIGFILSHSTVPTLTRSIRVGC